MRINNNIEAMTTRNSLFQVGRDMSKTLQKLSTGLRINSAADDAAGLGVSENLRTQVRGMGQALKNTQDAIAMLNIADGALGEQANIMQRMRELVIQAKNDTYTQTERDYMGQEFGQLMSELDRIAATTRYNGMTLFAIPEQSGNNTNGRYTSTTVASAPETAHKTIMGNVLPNGGVLGDSNDLGSGHHFNMMIGQNYTATDAAAFNSAVGRQFYNSTSEDMVTIGFAQMDTNTLFHMAPQAAIPDRLDGNGFFGDFSWNPGTDMGDGFMQFRLPGATLGTKLDIMLKLIDGGQELSSAVKSGLFFNATTQSPTGLDRINKMRATIGAMTNRLEHTVNNLMNQEVATQSAESLIRDVDFAAEATALTKSQILIQSSTSMLSQANMKPQSVLQLIQ